MVAAQFHAGVDVLGAGQPFGQHEEGLVDHGHQNAVDHKTRGVLHGDGTLAQLHGHGVYGRVRGIAGLQTANDFDQRHHGHRVEEVHADEAVRTSGHSSQLGDADRTGVGGDQGLGRQHAVELAQDLDFQFEVFGGGLNHQLGALEVVVAGGALDAGQRHVLVGGGQLVFLDQPIQATRYGGQAFLHGGFTDVHHHHV